MIEMKFEGKSPKKILCLGAHCDDIEIGCGGTILKYAQSMEDLQVYWIVFSSEGHRGKEAIRSANDFLKGVFKKRINILRFRNGFFPQYWGAIKEYFEEMKRKIAPDIIFTHCRGDLHQDHRVINELTWNTFRDHFILEYEIPKYDADLGNPNFFVHINKDICNKKIEIIWDRFKSQQEKQWFTRDTFTSLLRLRGIESNAPQIYAEGFYCRKIIV